LFLSQNDFILFYFILFDIANNIQINKSIGAAVNDAAMAAPNANKH